MLVFVNNVFITSDNIEAVEFVLHDEVSLINTYVTLKYKEAMVFCSSCVNKGYKVVDWVDGKLKFNKNMRVTQLPDGMSATIGTSKEESIKSVYNLYWDLAKVNAIYIPDLEMYETNFIGLCTGFDSLRVSRSTMNVLISFYNVKEDVWVTHKLIDAEKDKISQKEFYCAIPNDKKDMFLKYGLKEIKQITLNNKEFTIFQYGKNLAIYRNVYMFTFPEPVIVKYVLDSLKHRTTLTALKVALKTTKSDLGLQEDFLPKGKKEIRKSSLFNSSFGVFFTDTFQKVPKTEYDRLYVNVLSLYESLKNKGAKQPPSLESVRAILPKLNFPVYFDKATHTLLAILMASGGVNINFISFLSECLQNTKMLLLYSDLYLYSIRLSVYQNPSVVDCKFGSSVSYIRSTEGSVRVEVWV